MYCSMLGQSPGVVCDCLLPRLEEQGRKNWWHGITTIGVKMDNMNQNNQTSGSENKPDQNQQANEKSSTTKPEGTEQSTTEGSGKDRKGAEETVAGKTGTNDQQTSGSDQQKS